MGRETQINILLRIEQTALRTELLLKDLLEAFDGAPVSTRKGKAGATKKLEDFYTVGAFPWKHGKNGAAKCGLCKVVTQKETSMEGPQGHLWLRHRKQMKAAGIKY